MQREPEILYQDEDLAVINKPPGWVVNAAETTAAPTIQAWWAERLTGTKRPAAEESDASWHSFVPADFDPSYGTPEEIFAQRQGVVHRLDKDTSGALVLAANPGALVNLLSQFKNRQTHKTYTALVHGKFQIPEGLIDLPLGRASHDRQVFAVRPDGREARTKYRVTQTYPAVDAASVWAKLPEGFTLPQQTKPLTQAALTKKFEIYQGFSLLECQLLTGRTHQIRVHLAHQHHPIVGDVTYLGRKRQALDPLWCPRQFLHASRLEFVHPRTDEVVAVEAPLADDLAQAAGFLLS